jgi:hypothetical protein
MPSPPDALSPGERWLAACLVAAIVGAMLLPPIAQSPAYHAFADRRTFVGIPYAADVLSSVAFAIVGGAAIAGLARAGRTRHDRVTEACLWTLAVALAATGLGSVVYHLDPRDATLVADRLPMSVAFASVLAMAIAQRISARAGVVALAILPPLALASVVHWQLTGNVAPYAIVQYGAALGVVAIVASTPRRDDPFPWSWIVAGYALAKACEAGDAWIYASTGGIVAGHALKHAAAAAAGAAALLPAWRTVRRST